MAGEFIEHIIDGARAAPYSLNDDGALMDWVPGRVMCIDDSGVVYFIHARDDAGVGVMNITLSRRTNIGVWQQEVITTEASNTQARPCLYVDKDNNIHMVWTGVGFGTVNPSVQHINYAVWDSFGSLSSIEVIEDGPIASHIGSIAIAEDGRIFVAITLQEASSPAPYSTLDLYERVSGTWTLKRGGINYASLTTGTTTGADSGIQIVDSAASFLSDGISPGDAIANGNSIFVSEVDAVVTDTLITVKFQSGNVWRTGDSYDVLDATGFVNLSVESPCLLVDNADKLQLIWFQGPWSGSGTVFGLTSTGFIKWVKLDSDTYVTDSSQDVGNPGLAGGAAEGAVACQLAIDSGDDAFIVWKDNLAADQILYRRQDGGAWIAQNPLAVAITGEKFGPATITVDSSDNVNVAYIRGITQFVVKVLKSTDNGASFGAEISITGDGSNQFARLAGVVGFMFQPHPSFATHSSDGWILAAEAGWKINQKDSGSNFTGPIRNWVATVTNANISASLNSKLNSEVIATGPTPKFGDISFMNVVVSPPKPAGSNEERTQNSPAFPGEVWSVGVWYQQSASAELNSELMLRYLKSDLTVITQNVTGLAESEGSWAEFKIEGLVAPALTAFVQIVLHVRTMDASSSGSAFWSGARLSKTATIAPWPDSANNVLKNSSFNDTEMVTFSSQITTPEAILTGTVIPKDTEQEVRGGSSTVIITLTGDTWVAAGGTFDAQRQAIIDGLTSNQSETTGWNTEVRDKEVVGAVARTNDTVVTITLSARSTYQITANEEIIVTVPAAALVTSGAAVIATPHFQITKIDDAVITGTLLDVPQAQREIAVQNGGKTVIITLTNFTWDSTIGADNSKTTALINGLDSNKAEAQGWNSQVRDKLKFTDVTRNSGTVVTILLPSFGLYSISADEIVTVTVPDTALA